jgi:hypothetical protein
MPPVNNNDLTDSNVPSDQDVTINNTTVDSLTADDILPPIPKPTFNVKDVVRTALTGPDNASADISHITLILGSLTIVGLQIYVTLTTGVFDILNFAGGYTAVSAGGAWAIKHKSSTEPPIL